jgi:hypothetical protein
MGDLPIFGELMVKRMNLLTNVNVEVEDWN